LSLYTIAVKPNDYNTRLSEFVSQLFNALAQMVQRKDIQGAETLGIISAFALYFQFLPAQLLQACNHRRTQRSHILIITTRHQTTLHTTPHRFHQVQMRTITR
jgi:hypothetical protein